ncbi:hypothetical protein E8E12_000892 [Didymella heteroderae]|uniref:Uncharacterized protein n=1 Tax=Didymella heteroderae TaxID=1769908 RepID=A0A9P5BVB3_9PLEO|nr:hypothetical protein E8E12_000892 [Didymella heteroderae]
MTNLSARIKNAAWEEWDENVLQDVISVLDTVYKAATRSETFSRALPYTISVKERSSSAHPSPVFLASSGVIQSKSVLQIPDSSLPSGILPLPRAIPPPGVLLSPSSIQPTDAPSFPSLEHRSQLRKATKSSIALSEAYVANTISLEQDQLNDIHNFLGKISKNEVNFWNPNLQVRVTTEEADLLRQPINYGVFLCSVLHDTQVHHKILQRFARLAVYNLTVQGRSAEELANAFQGSTLLRNVGANLQRQIEGYIQAGNRYSVMARELGGLGSIFFLPPKVGHSL